MHKESIKEKRKKVRELVKLMKEIFLLKQDENSMVGLSGFKKIAKPQVKRIKKKVNKEVRLSELMRRA